MPSGRLRTPTVRAVALAAVVALVATGALVGAALADDHTRDEAPHYGPDEKGNATFQFLEQEDHYPGAENVSVRYTLKGGAAYGDVGATDGLAADRFVVETDAVDHADCTVENVAAFGVDRGDDGAAGEVDEDLLRSVRRMDIEDDAILVEFYEHEDFGGDPPRIARDDRIVLEVSDASAGGGCADTTEEVGFYDADPFLNGTGPAESDRADETYGFTVGSEYTYVCECEDEEEAREGIGYPPGPATPSGTSTATPTQTGTPTPTPTERPRTPTPDGTPLLTATVDESVGGANVSANASVGEDGVSADVSVDGPGANRAERAAVDPQSPTPGDGPGFGAGVAAATLLGCATLVRRRRA